MKRAFVLIVVLLGSVLVYSAAYAALGWRAPRIFDGSYHRVIAEHVDEQYIDFLQKMGCLIRHKLKDSASFECPEVVIPQLNVRKARVLHITELDADEQIGADLVWFEGITGSGVKVAVLDTGIDIDHPELADSYLGGYDYVNNDATPDDEHGHGTHVSGTITSDGDFDLDSKGAAPDAGIYMYKVCDGSGVCYEDDMMAAMEAAVAAGVRVMSISIGGGSYTTENCDWDSLASKVNWAVAQGIAAVVSAGNNGKGVSTPGCASGAITVGAVDDSDDVPNWSGRGPALDIVSPGVGIYSTYDGGGYGTMSGTSMATPLVAGVIALLLEADPSLSNDDIKIALYDTATPVNRCYSCARWWGPYCFGEREVPCNSDITGAGVVDAYQAYLSIELGEPGCSSDDECDNGLYCDGAETCFNGTCQDSVFIDCSGLDDQCNYGICDEASDQCLVQARADGTVCSDGLYCTVNDQCSSGLCVGSPIICGDGGQCSTGYCDEDADTCVIEPVADDTVCDDSQFCTVNDICTSGACVGSARDCSDGVACTVDSCNEASDSCVNSPDDSHCDNGLYCDGSETCDSVLGCQAGTPVVCFDGNSCTTDICNEVSDDCDYIWPDCGLADSCCGPSCDSSDPDCAQGEKCWSADNVYLYRYSTQARKFCKCAEGTYDYVSYSYYWGRTIVYRYVDTNDNEHWDVSARYSYLPVYRVQCDDGNWYYTNQDYYR